MDADKQYFHYDHIGNLVQTVNASGQVTGDLFYTPFGEPIGGTIHKIDHNQPFGFSTKRGDFASGLLYFGYRFYVPHMERWLNRDPIGIDGGLNIYGYLEQNPIMYVDPNGFRPVPGNVSPKTRCSLDCWDTWLINQTVSQVICTTVAIPASVTLAGGAAVYVVCKSSTGKGYFDLSVCLKACNDDDKECKANDKN